MPSSTTSSCGTSLILRLQKHESTAWQQLVDLYAPLIYHWCRQCSLSESDAADVMQDVFASVSKSISTYRRRTGSRFRGWLWTITQNKIRDFCRHLPDPARAAGGSHAQNQLHQIPDWPSDDEPTADIEANRLLHRALELIKADFHEKTWTAFWRSTVDGHDTAWIAEDLGISPNSVRQAKSRVLRRLRDQLGDR